MQGVMYCTCGNICPTEAKLASIAGQSLSIPSIAMTLKGTLKGTIQGNLKGTITIQGTLKRTIKGTLKGSL